MPSCLSVRFCTTGKQTHPLISHFEGLTTRTHMHSLTYELESLYRQENKHTHTPSFLSASVCSAGIHMHTLMCQCKGPYGQETSTCLPVSVRQSRPLRNTQTPVPHSEGAYHQATHTPSFLCTRVYTSQTQAFMSHCEDPGHQERCTPPLTSHFQGLYDGDTYHTHSWHTVSVCTTGTLVHGLVPPGHTHVPLCVSG